MQPEQYQDYAKVFDYFSNPEFFPPLKLFIDRIAKTLPANAHVTDVGAGTGYHAEQLLNQMPLAQLTVVEPSADMMPIARKRLGDRANYLFKSIHKALAELGKQDAFIFQRSLYVIYKNKRHCQKLFYQLNKKLNMNGYIFIYELKQKINFDNILNHILQAKTFTPAEKDELMDKFIIFRAANERFNEGADRGEFHLFTEAELDNLLENAGFIRVFSGDFSHFYRKVRKVGWFR